MDGCASITYLGAEGCSKMTLEYLNSLRQVAPLLYLNMTVH